MQIYSLSLGLSSAYLVQGDAGTVLIDAGMPGQQETILRRLRARGCDDLRLIWISHAHLDHYGSAAALHRLTGVPVAIHAADAPAMAGGETHLGTARGRGRLLSRLMPWIERAVRPQGIEANLLLADGDTLDAYGIPARVLHTPGHTPGSCCLLVAEGALFCGDLLSTAGAPHLQHLYAADWAQLAASFQRLQGLSVERAYPGHGTRPLTGRELQDLLAAHQDQ